VARLFHGPPRSPFDDPREAEAAARFGMWLFLISLAALFAASLLGYVVMYVQLSQSGQWPRDLPGVPGGLVLSTLLLVVTSIAVERAARDAFRMAFGSVAPSEAETTAGVDRVRRDLTISSLLGAAFLFLQAFAWISWLVGVGDRLDGVTTYRFALTGFWVLTGIHALHVLGGILPLGLETWLAWRRPKTDMNRAGSIRFTAMYWHFLGVVWVLLYALLLLTI
jgi:cytochrome c oxidase subunit 3